MDRRTLLAMVLIFFVFVGWSAINRPAPKPVAATDAADSLVAVDTPVEVSAERSLTATEPVSAETPQGVQAEYDPAPGAVEPAFRPLNFPALDAMPVEVAHDLFTLTVDPRGGVVTSWRGVEYRRELDDPTPLELVPQPGLMDDDRPAADLLIFDGGTLDMGAVVFEVERQAPVDGGLELVLRAVSDGGIVVRKIMTFRQGDYAFDVRYEVSAADDPVSRDNLRVNLGSPKRAVFAWDRGIAVTEEQVKSFVSRPAGFRSYGLVGDDIQFRDQGKLDRDDRKGYWSKEGSVRFAGVQNKYFTIAGFVRNAVTDMEERTLTGAVALGGDRETMRQSWEITLPLTLDGDRYAVDLSYYFGPSRHDVLASYGSGLERTVNLGWKWIQPISELVLKLMNWLHGFIPNYGWVIVVISILSKLVFWPLTARGTEAMRKTSAAQARLKPKMDELKKKHGKDAQRYNQEMMKLYKEEGVNPLAGMAGCLPLLIQMPVFIALYQVLYNLVDLRHEPWLLWINDLSQPDMLFALPFGLPLLGSSFNLLPIIMAVATWLQSKLQPSAGGGGQMAAMTTIMPVMMLFFLYNMPSGLVIYWTINTAMTALQSWLVNNKARAAGGAQTA